MQTKPLNLSIITDDLLYNNPIKCANEHCYIDSPFKTSIKENKYNQLILDILVACSRLKNQNRLLSFRSTCTCICRQLKYKLDELFIDTIYF